jgi:hypothetical protein
MRHEPLSYFGKASGYAHEDPEKQKYFDNDSSNSSRPPTLIGGLLR